jgi:VWFA-related protein
MKHKNLFLIALHQVWIVTTQTASALLIALLLSPVPGALAQQAPQQPRPRFMFTINDEIVLTNVVVRNKKTGELVKGLKQSDFTILEDNKPQHIDSFDYEAVDELAQAAMQNEATVSGSTGPAPDPYKLLTNKDPLANPAEMRNHRLIVMFFDLTSMQPDDIDRAVEAAQTYVKNKMQPADLVALVSLDTSLKVDVDFTANKDLLLNGIGTYNGTEGAGFAEDTSSNTVEDSSSFSADDSEYNNLNTDRELFAIRSIAKSLSRVDQRKSMLYFSGGLTRNGIENEASLRSAVNAAVQANIAIYSVDSRGLQAILPVGDASTGSLRGNGAYSGAAVQNNLNANFTSQETLGTLSADTGGTAFFDSNDFSPAFEKVQHDTEAYYVLGYHSANPARDGRFRHLTVRLNNSDLEASVHLEYRPGYYAPADFQHSNTEDRERQLTEQLQSDLPASDVAVYVQALYFRLPGDKFFVPVSLVVPGSQIPFIKNGDRSKATLDVLGRVTNANNIQVGYVRDTVKLAVDESQQVQRKNIQYSTGFTLAPGKYNLKFVVRENQSGHMGSFEADIQIPDMKKIPLKMSSIVLASQMQPNTSKKDPSPLIRDGVEWIPNVPHVFRQDQHLYLLYELYDPTHEKSAPETQPASSPAPKNAVHVLTNIEFLSGSNMVYQTPLVQADTVNVPDRNAVSFQFDVALDKFQPGLYICQVNVIDDAGGSFSFPRTAMLVQKSQAAPAAAPTPAAAPPSPGTASSRNPLHRVKFFADFYSADFYFSAAVFTTLPSTLYGQ